MSQERMQSPEGPKSSDHKIRDKSVCKSIRANVAEGPWGSPIPVPLLVLAMAALPMGLVTALLSAPGAVVCVWLRYGWAAVALL